jgi:hypothetical protein
VAYGLALKGTTPLNTKVRYFKKQSDTIVTNTQYFQKYYQDYQGDYRKIKIVGEGQKLFMLYDTYAKIQLFPELLTILKATIISM